MGDVTTWNMTAVPYGKVLGTPNNLQNGIIKSSDLPLMSMSWRC